MKNKVLEKFRNRELSVGTVVQIGGPALVECLGRTGLDYVFLDTEHAPRGIEDLSASITAADAAGITPLVRINGITRSQVLRPLDVGAQGLVVPAVETVEEARELVSYAKFAPLGNRGFCPSRDGGWGFDPIAREGVVPYFEACNRETLLILQCETAGCLAHIEEIAAMDGVDGIFVGPFDLSIALGRPMDFACDEMRRALERILAACREHGKLSMIFCGDAQTARERAAEGFDSVTAAMDSTALIACYQAMVAQIRP